MITITESAAAKVKKHLEESSHSEAVLRLKVAGGGCSGLRYELMIETQIGVLDEQIEQHGARVVVDPKSALHLAGTTLDYLDELNESGFKVTNPNATATCGCGESFST